MSHDSEVDAVDTEVDAVDTDETAEPAFRSLRLGYVVVLMALAFAGGFLARGSADMSGTPVQTVPGVSVPQGGGTGPALDESQLRGGLPSGHPPISATTSPSGALTSPSPAPSPTPSGSPAGR